MKLSHRAMRPEDISECVDIVANHPVIGPRYGPMIEHLAAAWLSLLQCEAAATMVVRADEGSRAPVCFVGVSVFLRDNFVGELKTPPHFWVGPELTKRMMVERASPLLTGKQLRDANSRDGMNLVVWEGCARPGYEAHSELHRYMMAVFIEEHQGYLWKEVFAAQSETPDRLEATLKTGGALWDVDAGGYTSKLRKDPTEIVRDPHILGITRELEAKRPGDWAGSWVGALFDYHPPMLGFNRSEQRMLSCAVPGATDEQLAEALETSLSVVKKMWISIYRRVEDYLPELVANPLPSESPASGRGREKRRRLLAYLREHPEELRPVSRRLLGNTNRDK